MLDLIAFDADDTLWHNEILYSDAQERFQDLLAPYGLDGRARRELYETEMHNLHYFGYGTKGFALSMIETAIRLSEGQIEASEILEIIDLAKGMLSSEVRLLDRAPEVVAELAASYPLMLVTKGDLVDQERKVAQSGLGPYFANVEITSDKSEDFYRALLARHQVAPERFLMVGNSLRSDILPVIALGGHAVHIPYHVTWAHEAVGAHGGATREYAELEDIGLLPMFVQQLCQGDGAGDS
jgi:putative hydrolase of the HAD superfamily